MKKCLLMASTGWLILSFLLTLAEEVQAIPAFARKYKTSCTTCHIAVPKRNAFGEAFRRNGYVMPQGDELLIKQEPVSLGADEWKEQFPDAVWPGVLPAEFPIAAYVHQRLVADFGKSKKDNNIEFDMPHEFELFMGGTFGEGLSFFGEWVAFEKGKNAEGLKRFFFQFNDVAGPENALNIRVGRFEPGITEGYVDNNRITMEHPLTLDYKASGKWRPRDQQSGIELNGFLAHRYQYAFGVVNGENKTIDDNTNEKDFYGRVAYKFGGLALDGFQEKELTTLKQTDNWADNALTVGVYTYAGNHLVKEVDNDFRRFGLDLYGNYDRFDLFAGAILGTDDNPSGLAEGTDKEKERKSTAAFVEGQYLVYPWLIGALRLERAASEQNDDDLDKYLSISPNITILGRPNVRFTVEGLFRLEADKTVGGQTVEANNSEKFKWLKLNVLFVF